LDVVTHSTIIIHNNSCAFTLMIVITGPYNASLLLP